MIYIIFAIIGFISWVFGVWAFSQIVGCIQTRSHFFTSILWTVLLIIVSFLFVTCATDLMISYFIALAISLIQVLSAGRIE